MPQLGHIGQGLVGIAPIEVGDVTVHVFEIEGVVDDIRDGDIGDAVIVARGQQGVEYGLVFTTRDDDVLATRATLPGWARNVESA